MLLLKALGRLVEMLLMAVLALAGLGVTLYCVSEVVGLGSARPDRLLHLPLVRRRVGRFLADVAAPGSIAILALVCGVAAVLLGFALVVAILGSRRERLLVIERDATHGDLLARTRTVARMVSQATAVTPGVTGGRRPRLRLVRSGERGRLRVLANRAPGGDGAAIDRAVHDRVDPIVDGLPLRTDIRVRVVRTRAERREQARRREEHP